MDTPNAYSDPYWTDLASAAEAKAGLPAGLLSAIVLHGEKSNNDAVSSAGAKTPFQITPETRKLVLDRDGIDAYLSPQNAAEAAATVVKDGLNWAKQRSQDPDVQSRLAAGYYHAGGNTANWGPKTNAYISRVDSGQKAIQSDALSNDFAAYMAANPAVPAPKQAPASPQDALSRDFAAWKATKDWQDQTGNTGPRIPGGDPVPGVPDAPTTVGQDIVGAGEAGLSALTGTVLGYPAALATQVATLGEPGAADAVGQSLTYSPKTAAGQQQAAVIGQLAGDILTPLAGAAPELAQLGKTITPAATALRTAAGPAVAAVQKGAAAVPDLLKAPAARVAGIVGGQAANDAPTSGTMGSAGAAGTDLALQRQTTAASLPVPIKLTKGQATRDQGLEQFEAETAKNPEVGGPLRENGADQNTQLGQNFDAMIDRTGAEKASDIEAGRFIVDDTLKSQAAASKARYKAKYDAAEAAGELEQPVSLQSVIDHLNESAPEATTAPILNTARNLAIKLGIAKDEDGTLVALPPKGTEAPAAPRQSRVMGEPAPAPAADPGATLATTEQFRKAINRNTDYDPSNQRQASIINGLVDSATEGKGGALYAEARKAYQRHAQLYRNNAIVADLLATTKGTADRKVALEDVVNHIVLNGSREDLSALRRTLHVGDQQGGVAPGAGQGGQAWKEIQAATWRHLADEAGVEGKFASRDVRGNPIVTFAGLNKAVNKLDDGGKLDFILGKQGAQTARDIRDVAAVIKTFPPGSVNSSNTASAIAVMLADAGVTGLATGVPAPVMSLVRLAVKHQQNAKLKARVADALAGLPEPKQPQGAF